MRKLKPLYRIFTPAKAGIQSFQNVMDEEIWHDSSIDLQLEFYYFGSHTTVYQTLFASKFQAEPAITI
jgi:hypothetical protein